MRAVIDKKMYIFRTVQYFRVIPCSTYSSAYSIFRNRERKREREGEMDSSAKGYITRASGRANHAIVGHILATIPYKLFEITLDGDQRGGRRELIGGALG